MNAPDSPPPLRVAIHTPWIHHFIETVALALIADDSVEVLIITNDGEAPEGAEHPWCVQRLRQFSRVRLLGLEAPAESVDWFYFGLVSAGRLPGALISRWSQKARHTGFFTGCYLHGWKSVAGELLRSFPHYLRASAACFEAAAGSWHPYFFLRRHFHYQPAPHPQFLSDPAYRTAMFAEPPEGDRQFRIGFIGNINPPERAAALRALQQRLATTPGLSIVEDFPADRPPPGRRQTLWIEYGTGGKTRGLPPLAYAQALRAMDFCLCPAGWSEWTHRTVEAILGGAIPVLEEYTRYNIGLEDGKNCVVVRNGDWLAALNRCLEADPGEVARWRSGCLDLARHALRPEIAMRRLRRDLLGEDR